MRNSKLYTIYMLFLTGCLAFVSCGDDKEYTTGMPEAKLINEITIDNLKSSTLYLAIGMDSIMEWTVNPADLEDKSVIWTSSDESVATVSQDGKITGVSVGEATITIAPNLGFGATEVVKSVPVKIVSSITKAIDIVFKNTETSVYQRSTLILTCDILPIDHTYDYLTWSSNDETIATVDANGVVKGIKPGFVTITAHTHDRSSVKASITIEVLESIIATDVSIDANQEFALYETYPLSFSLAPANATVATVKWESSDPSVVSIDSEGNITTHKYGSVKITATTEEGGEVEESILVADGFFRKDFSDGTIYPWEAQNGATYSFENGKLIVTFGSQSADKYRGDFVLAASNAGIKKVNLSAGTYRYFAIKMLIANNLVANWNGNGCVVLDTNNGRYNQPVGNGNNNYSIYVKNNETWTWDKPAVYYYDLQETFGNSGYKYSLTAPVEVSTFKFVMADYPKATSKEKYEVYWVRSFKTLEELKAFVDNE